MNKKIQGDLMLLITAAIWGSAFVAQRSGMQYIGPFTFNGIRSLIGCLVLLPLILVLSTAKKRTAEKRLPGGNEAADEGYIKRDKKERFPRHAKKTLVCGGILCGLILFTASTLQQIGLVYSEAGKAAFITALYIVLVPVVGIFVGKHIRPVLWICVLAAIAGLYLLCIKDDFSIGKGDILELLCALTFTVHILVVDYFSPRADGVKLSCIQFLVCGLLSVPFMLIFEDVDFSQILQCWLPILYAGVLSCGVAYTFQILAQKNTEPTVASLIMSLESVFALLGGWIILGERLSAKELTGCIIMFAAIIVSQIPSREERAMMKK